MKHLRLAAAVLLASGSLLRGEKIELQNNHAFPIHMPWTLDGGKGRAIMVDLPASGHATVDTDVSIKGDSPLSVAPDGKGVSLQFGGKDLGRLSWSVVLHTVEPAYITADKDAHSAGRPADFKPLPLPLQFSELNFFVNPGFRAFVAKGTSAGLDVSVELRIYPGGFLDVTTTVTNQSAPTKNVYAAVLTRWEQPAGTTRTVDYDNTIRELKDSTPWRVPGDRHFFVLRGLNWLNSSLPTGQGVLWINEFAPSFTVHHAARGKTPAQWIGGNSPQLDQEAYLEGDALVHVTELAHGNVKSYRGRLDDYVLPDASQPMVFTHRLAFTDRPVDAEAAANAFVAYTSFNPRKGETLHFGTPGVMFGTAYFPYSTFGENFIKAKLPGMSQDSYWPLAADVVKNYKLFADQIRTDLRIAKSMGFQSIRLHHLEMIFNNPVGTSSGSSGEQAEHISDADRDAFLDFFFAELKHCGLTALLDVKIKPEQIADLLKRYRDTIDGVEIDNEVLIFGIKDDDVPYWKRCYDAVKAVAPDVPVQWTAHTNTGAFNRLTDLGVPFDRLGQHAYMDAVEACPMSRDFALQVSNYATKVNKPAAITEWNWRFLTRLTEEDRAKVYAPIFENVLKSRAMSAIYQFQFNDGLAMSPMALKGIRHYELLNLSRRPKAEAAEFERLIRTYSDPASAVRCLETHYQYVPLPADFPNRDNPVILVSVKNTTDRDLDVTASAEGPAELQPKLTSGANPESFILKAGQTYTAQLSVTFPKESLPGFYYAFVRFETKDGLVAYAPVEFRRIGQPTFDKSTHPDVAASSDAFNLDLTKPTAVVYGDDCPIPELEAAWVVYQTLESACGRRVLIFTARELPKEGITNVIYVGTPKSLKVPAADKQSITRLPNSNTLVISGATSQEAALAAMDYTLRYWKTAKDAACRRVPLVDREIAKGGDASQLP